MSSEELKKTLEEKNERIGLMVFHHFDQFLRDNDFDGKYIDPYVTDPARLHYHGIGEKNRNRYIDFEWYSGHLNAWVTRESIEPESPMARFGVKILGWVVAAFILLGLLLATPFLMLGALIKYLRKPSSGKARTSLRRPSILSFILSPDPDYIGVAQFNRLLRKGDISSSFVNHNEEEVIKAQRLFVESAMLPIIRGEKWPSRKLALLALRRRNSVGPANQQDVR